MVNLVYLMFMFFLVDESYYLESFDNLYTVVAARHLAP